MVDERFHPMSLPHPTPVHIMTAIRNAVWNKAASERVVLPSWLDKTICDGVAQAVREHQEALREEASNAR